MTTSMIMDLRSRFEVLQPSDEEESGYVAPQVGGGDHMDSRLHPCIPGNLELGTSNKLAVFAATKFEEVPCRRS